MNRWVKIMLGITLFAYIGFWANKKFISNLPHAVGKPIDTFNGVVVYYNGKISHVSGRNLTADNYNLGLRYQCVEFVKRYYYEFLKHKMPDPYGHAKDFYDKTVSDGQKNGKRGLFQYSNPSLTKPSIHDLVIFAGHVGNSFGHVAIISNVNEHEIEIVQQNPGIYGNSRERFPLIFQNGFWKINHERILGWLRKND
jgi:surface antigen